MDQFNQSMLYKPNSFAWGALPQAPVQSNPLARFGYQNAPSNIYSDTTPVVPKVDGTGGNGFNWGNFSNGLSTALGGLQTLGNLWGGIQAGRLAKEQFNFQRDITNTNLNNSIKDYNTTLEGRMQARAAMETGDANAYADRIAERQLTR